MLDTRQVIDAFGEPGDWGNFVRIKLPFPMRIAWDLGKSVSQTWCHKLIKDPLVAALTEILEHYGYDRIKELGIDLYGGLVNVRKMRGGSDWSRHSWGIAIDLHPSKNGLRTRAPKAVFSKAEYKPMMDVFYKHGFINYGVEKGYDWMHFEFSMDVEGLKKNRFSKLISDLKAIGEDTHSSKYKEGYCFAVEQLEKGFNNIYG